MPNPINTNKASVRFIADGSITEFHFNFIIFETDDIEVYLGETLQTENFSITKATNSDGGCITFITAPSSGTIVTIARNLEVKRTTNFSESKAFRAKMLNHEFDYQVACLEQLTDDIKRNISVPVYGDSNVNTSLPLPKPGKAILWNADGTALINSNINVEELDSSVADSLSAATEASASAAAAVTAATEASAAAHNKAEKDLSNVTDDNVKAKSGTRFYCSSNLSISNSMTYNNNHGLTLPTPAQALTNISLICTTAANGHIIGDEVSVWGVSGATGYVDIMCPLKVNLTSTQYRFTTTTGIYLINKSSKAYEKIDNNNYKFKVSIWY